MQVKVAGVDANDEGHRSKQDISHLQRTQRDVGTDPAQREAHLRHTHTHPSHFLCLFLVVCLCVSVCAYRHQGLTNRCEDVRSQRVKQQFVLCEDSEQQRAGVLWPEVLQQLQEASATTESSNQISQQSISKTGEDVKL